MKKLKIISFEKLVQDVQEQLTNEALVKMIGNEELNDVEKELLRKDFEKFNNGER